MNIEKKIEQIKEEEIVEFMNEILELECERKITGVEYSRMLGDFHGKHKMDCQPFKAGMGENGEAYKNAYRKHIPITNVEISKTLSKEFRLII